MGELEVRPAYEAVLRDAGIATCQDVLNRSACLRDLDTRSNHRLALDGLVVFVKRQKPRGRAGPRNRELEGCEAAARLGVPTAPVVFSGLDARLGALIGHASLEPARPLDDLIREERLDAAAADMVLAALARHVATLHDGGRHHRDLYLNHVFVDPGVPEDVRAILDWERSGPHRRTWGRWVVKDLAAVRASLPDEAVFPAWLDRYVEARAAAVPPRRLARRIERKAQRIRAHVPRTPVGPDAPKSGAWA